MRDAAAVMVLLKRALKLASAAQQQVANTQTQRLAALSAPTWLFVDILNEYAFYFVDGNSSISLQILQVLVQ